MFRTIWSKTLRDYRVPILSFGFGLALLMVAGLAGATPALRDAYASIAQSLRFLGDPFATQTPEGYATTRYLELFVPLLLSIWAILAGARMLRGEEERGTLDVLLATPQPRTRVILEKLLALVIALLLVALLMALGTIAGESRTDTQVNVVRALLTALNVSLLAFFFATVALLFSQFTSSRGAAVGLTSGLMVLAILLDGTGRTVSGAWVQYLSPFYYYNLNRPLISSFNDAPAAALLLLGLSLLFAAISVALFVRRDSGRPAFAWQRNHTNDKQQVERSLKKAERDVSVRSISLRALSAQAWVSFWWLFGIVAWCAFLVLLIPSAQEPLKKALAQSPNLAKIYSASIIGTNAGFLSVLVFGLGILLVVIFAMTLALTWAGDLENGRLELLLGTPTSRQRMLLERFGAVLLMVLLASVFAWLATVVAAQIANLSIDQGHVIIASFSMLPLALIIVGLVYALAGRLRYGAVLGIVTAYIALAFLAEFLKSLLNLPDWLLSFSIFHLYGSPMTDGINWGAFLGMTSVALVLLLIGLIQFRNVDVERG
jgi:polyether ionophore transport system permease protein